MDKYLKFENIKSTDEFIKKTYFQDIDIVRKFELEHYLQMVVDRMESEGVVTKGYFEIDEDKETITVGSKERGIGIGVSVNTDKTTQSKVTLANPFGKGGNVGMEFSAGIYKNLNGTLFYQDRHGSRISLSKSSIDPIILSENFKTNETALSYSFSFLNHLFSIQSSDSDISVPIENTNKEHKSHTGSFYKTSITHVYKFFKANELINPSNAFYGKLQSELSLPLLSSCSFFKSNLNLSYILPLYKMFNFKIDISTGGIFNFSSNKSPFVPFSDRFFNGKSFNFPGYVDSSLTQDNKSPYIGGNWFYTARTSLLYKINDNANVMFYHSWGNTVLTLGNKDGKSNNFKSNFTNLFSPNKVRNAIGLGVSVDMGPAYFEGSIVKPLKYSTRDQLNGFAFEINLKL